MAELTLAADKRQIGGLGIYMVKRAWMKSPTSVMMDKIS